MLSIPLITIIFREIVEIALVLSLVSAYARRLPNFYSSLFFGVFLGCIGSIGIAFSLEEISSIVNGSGQDLMNMIVLLVTAILLWSMLLFMKKHSMRIKDKVLNTSSFWGLCFIVAFTIFREGSEIVLLTYSFSISLSESVTVFSVITGIACGLLFGVSLFLGMRLMPLDSFFKFSSILLIFVIAGLISQAMNSLISTGLISSEIIWDSSFLISQSSLLGELLHMLFGYVAQPTYLQLIAYLCTLVILSVSYRLIGLTHQKSL